MSSQGVKTFKGTATPDIRGEKVLLTRTGGKKHGGLSAAGSREETDLK